FMENRERVQAEHITKIFGDQPEKAVPYIEKEYPKQEIFRETGQLVALRDVSFSVNEGEIFVIMGLSGSGKSTLLRCINRLHDPTYGNIIIEGTDITSLSTSDLRTFRRNTLGMVFQNFALFPNRTVLDNVTFGLEIQGVNKQHREATGKQVLETVGLEDYAYKKTSQLSGGMQQRVGLARALAIDPDILLMDEPFSALDPLIRSGLQDELLRLHGQMSKTILFVTHDLNEAVRVGDRIAIVNQEGQISQIAPPEEILLHPADDYVARFLKDVDRPSVVRLETIMKQPEFTYIQEVESAVRMLKDYNKSYVIVLDETDVPIAVVDDHNRIVGEVSRSDVVEILNANQGSYE
ncbi:MAG: glycine betaine/L-proline ABC transporter ATP-binding protein, partial [Candidatus Paceibacteria bacterium]